MFAEWGPARDHANALHGRREKQSRMVRVRCDVLRDHANPAVDFCQWRKIAYPSMAIPSSFAAQLALRNASLSFT